jgi:hypothetical protein
MDTQNSNPKLVPMTIDYLITWNPNTQINDTKDMNLTEKYNHYILEYFGELNKFCTAWEINPELANGRLHFHGFITFPADKLTKRIYAKWKAKLYKYGNIKACPVYYNLCASMEYCRKDQADMQDRISSPVPYQRIHSLDSYRVYPLNHLLNTLLQDFD